MSVGNWTVGIYRACKTVASLEVWKSEQGGKDKGNNFPQVELHLHPHSNVVQDSSTERKPYSLRERN